jgi:predicted RNA binding protein YcfA (HicA-like mRNA interferase family)
LYGNTQLQRHYSVANSFIRICDIFPKSKDETIVLYMEPNKHILRIKEKKLINILHRYGYKKLQHKYSYIQFSQKSPINTQKIEDAIATLYSKLYSKIDIISINTQPRSFVTTLPKDYTIHFPKKAYLNQHATALFYRTVL